MLVYRVFCGLGEADARAVRDILVNHPDRIREEVDEMRIRDGFVLRSVVDEYDVDQETVAADLDALLGSLDEMGVLERE